MLAQELVSIVGLPPFKSRARRRVHFQCGPYLRQQHLGPEGLHEKGCCACLEASLPRPFVALRRQDHNGDLNLCCPEMAEEVEATHPAHPEIEDQAPDDLATAGA